MILHFYELPKLPKEIRADNLLELWLSLFKAKTVEELKRIEKTGVSEMSEAIKAYNNIIVSPEFREAERLREKARHDEAQVIYTAEARGEKRSDKKWRGVVAEKDAIIAEKDAENEKLCKLVAELQGKMGN